MPKWALNGYEFRTSASRFKIAWAGPSGLDALPAWFPRTFLKFHETCLRVPGRVAPGDCSPGGRVRRCVNRHPLPSELHVKVSPHAAQAFANAPGLDGVRLSFKLT